MAEKESELMKKLCSFIIKLSCYAVFFAAIFCSAAYGGYLYITPSSHISLNSNPAVKYSVNYYNRVIKVETDSETELVLNHLDLTNKDLIDAIQLTIEELNSNGYFSQNEDTNLIITVSNKDEDKANSLTEKLNNEIQIRYGEYAYDKIKAIFVLNK